MVEWRLQKPDNICSNNYNCGLSYTQNINFCCIVWQQTYQRSGKVINFGGFMNKRIIFASNAAKWNENPCDPVIQTPANPHLNAVFDSS